MIESHQPKIYKPIIQNGFFWFEDRSANALQVIPTSNL